MKIERDKHENHLIKKIGIFPSSSYFRLLFLYGIFLGFLCESDFRQQFHLLMAYNILFYLYGCIDLFVEKVTFLPIF